MLYFTDKTSFSGIDRVRNNTIYSALKVDDNMPLKQSSTPLKVSNENITSSRLTQEISFTDKISGQNITLKISDENLNKLKSNFNSNDFSKDEKGNLILKGKAGDFVSGWFGDIAYQRGYLKADYNQDGMLDNKEKQNTSAGYAVYGIFQNKGKEVLSVNALGTFSYAKTSNQNKDSIENELNNTIQKDKDMDGVLKLSELESKEQTLAIVKEHVRNSSIMPPLPSADEIVEYLEKEKQNQDNAEQILDNNELEKVLKQDNLAVNTADVSKLSKNQKEALKSQELKQNDNMLDLASSLKSDIRENLSLDIKV